MHLFCLDIENVLWLSDRATDWIPVTWNTQCAYATVNFFSSDLPPTASRDTRVYCRLRPYRFTRARASLENNASIRLLGPSIYPVNQPSIQSNIDDGRLKSGLHLYEYAMRWQLLTQPSLSAALVFLCFFCLRIFTPFKNMFHLRNFRSASSTSSSISMWSEMPGRCQGFK